MNLLMERFLVVHYAELGLKKGNRTYFEEWLCRNIQTTLQGCGATPRVRRISGRLLVELPDVADLREIRERMRGVFGVAFFSEARRCSTAIEVIAETAWELVRDQTLESFAVDTRRSDKSYPKTSVEVNREVGACIQARSGARVNLSNPSTTIWIEIVDNQAFVYSERTSGAGGLPANISGRVAVLLSGGIDSPVAAWKLMKRGCTAVFVHFHSFPYTNQESQDKAKQIVELLARLQFQARLYLVPFAEIQRHIMVHAPMELRVILYRRYMMRMAERIARRERARMLVTGDCVGQVASQTIANMDVVSRAVEMPILRPLVGDDKEDIVRLAKRIGTFAISTLPDQDCCSLFVPKHPETRARLEDVLAAESKIDVREAMEQALKASEVLLQSAVYAESPVRHV